MHVYKYSVAHRTSLKTHQISTETGTLITLSLSVILQIPVPVCLLHKVFCKVADFSLFEYVFRQILIRSIGEIVQYFSFNM